MTIREYLSEETSAAARGRRPDDGPRPGGVRDAVVRLLPGRAADIVTLLAKNPGVKHIKVEDGPGRRLGRSFR